MKLIILILFILVIGIDPISGAYVNERIMMTNDSYTYSQAPTTNYGTGVYNWGWTYYSTYEQYAWFKWDALDMKKYGTIYNASFEAKCFITDANPTVNFHIPNSNWNESTITWNNQPTYTALIASQYVSGGMMNYNFSINITNKVKNEWVNGINNTGIVIVVGTGGSHSIRCNSKENPTEEKSYLNINHSKGIHRYGYII